MKCGCTNYLQANMFTRHKDSNEASGIENTNDVNAKELLSGTYSGNCPK